MKKIGIACDHAGFELKEHLVDYLKKKGYEVEDFGTDSPESTDYPDTAHPLANAVAEGKYLSGMTLCGSGNGISMTANRHKGVRAALCWRPEIAILARQHNDANICSIPARFVSVAEAEIITDLFLSVEFEGGRHRRRIEKIENF